MPVEVDHSLSGQRAARVLEHLRLCQRKPVRIQVDNGPEFTSKVLDAWAHRHQVRLGFIRPGKPVENAHIESFNGRLRDECLNQHSFRNLAEARSLIEEWRQDDNLNRPHSALDYMTPAEYREKNQPKTAMSVNL